MEIVKLVPQKITIDPYVECSDCGWDGFWDDCGILHLPDLTKQLTCPECESTRINTSK
jgi:DNA-directed RNA polymerase subunit RPC12/RpoP